MPPSGLWHGHGVAPRQTRSAAGHTARNRARARARRRARRRATLVATIRSTGQLVAVLVGGALGGALLVLAALPGATGPLPPVTGLAGAGAVGVVTLMAARRLRPGTEAHRGRSRR